MTSKKNVGQQEMKKCGETPEPTEEIWLGKMLMITTMSFAKPTECCHMQCDNWNGASFQVHTEIGRMKFKQSKEGLCHHEFSPEFITGPQNRETQLLGTAEENAAGAPTNSKNKQKKHENYTTSLGHQQ